MVTHNGNKDGEWSMSQPFDMNTTNGKIVVFAIFLLLSFTFWYLGALGSEIDADIKYPVRYANIPETIDSEDVTERVNLYLEGTGYSMVKLKFTSKSNPIVIDFSKTTYRDAPVDSHHDYYILSSRLLQDITKQLKPTCKISSVKPDTLYFMVASE